MKRILFVAFFALLGYAASAQKLPNIKIEDQRGEIVETGSLIDHQTPAIISFWSTICKPCLLELDAVNEQFEDWQQEVPFRVYAVSVDDARSSSKARSLAAGRGWQFTSLYDKNQEFQRAMNVASIPYVFIIDKDGNVVYSHNGYTPGSELELLEQLRKLR